MNQWLTREIKKLMEEKNRSITDIEISERSVYNGSVPIIEVEFRDVESGILFSEDVIVDTKKDSFERILKDVEMEIDSFLKREEIA